MKTLRFASIAAAVLVIGCPHQSVVVDAGNHDATVAPDAGPPQPETVSVVVVDADGPIDGADLFIDDALGVRHHATTAADGSVTVGDVAWAPGAITITGVSAHHPMQSLAGFRRSDLGDRADASGTITLRMRHYFSSFDVSGSVQNADPSSTVTLSQDVSGTLAVTGTSFSGTIERDVPFRVFGIAGAYTTQTPLLLEFNIEAIVAMPHAALTADASFDVDFASPLALDTVAGTLPPPPAGSPLEHIFPLLYVSTDESELEASLGTATAMQVNATNLTFTAAWARGIDGAVVTVIYNANNGLRAQVVVDGPPTSTPLALSSDWPVPPHLISPANGGAASLHDPITVGGVDPTLPLLVTVADTTNRWYLELPANSASLTIPALPEGTDTTTWSAVHVRIDGCERWPGHHTRCRRTAGGERFSATL